MTRREFLALLGGAAAAILRDGMSSAIYPDPRDSSPHSVATVSSNASVTLGSGELSSCFRVTPSRASA